MALLLWLLHFLPFLMPQARLWGCNHLVFLPPVFTYSYLSAGIFVLLIFIRPLANYCEKIHDTLAEYLFGDKPWFRWLIFSAGMMILFWLLRMPVNLLGDGYSVINNIGNDLPVQFKWSEAGAIRLVYWVSQLLPLEGLEKGRYAYAIVSVLSGAITIYFFFLLAYELFEGAKERLLLFCLLLFSGWSLLFFGYSESYPVLWPFLTGYIFFSVSYLKGKGDLIIPALLAIIALLLHLQVVFYLVSFPILMLSKGKGLEIYRKYKNVLWLIAAGIVIAGIVVFVRKYQAIEFQQHFLPLLNGRPATPGYAVISVIHLMDILNEFILLIPIFPILIILGWRRWRTTLQDPINRFLLSFTSGGLVFLVIIDPTLGLGRDWDLFAIACLGPLLLLMRWGFAAGGKAIRSAPALVGLSLILVMPFFAANLQYQPHIDYVKWQLNLDKSRSKTGLVLLRGYYQDIGDASRADSLSQALNLNFPQVRLADEAKDLLLMNHNQEAFTLADEVCRAEPFSYEGYMLRGVASLQSGNLARAIIDLEQAVAFARWNSYAFLSLAQAYQAAGRNDKALAALRRVQELNPTLPSMYEGFVMTYNAMDRYDSSYSYARRLMISDPGNLSAYLFAGSAAFRLGDRINAKIYLTRYLEMNPPEAGRQTAMEILKQLQ
jgi:tetratricopeptide (TPR) repeat protein